jgi:zinc protease
MRREISELLGKRTLTPDELEMARNGLVRSLPANWETLRSLSGSLEELITYNLPTDYFDSYVEGILDLSATSVTESAREQIHVDDFIWVVVGDLSQIRPQFEASDLGPVEELDDPLI